jgi:hypothetical protein
MIDGFEYLNVEFFGSCGIEWHAELHEGIGKALNSNPDGSVTHVGPLRFRDWVVVDVDDAIQVVSNNLSDIVQLLEIVLVVGDKRWERDGRKVTDGGLIWGTILDDLRAKVGRLDRSKVFLIRLG